MLLGFAQPLIAYWMGAGFEGTVASFYALAFVGVLMVSHATQSSLLVATGGHRRVAAVWIVEGAANLGLSLPLVKRYGAVGVALGTAIPMAVGHIGVLTPSACRRVGVPIRRYVLVTVLPAIAGAIPTALCCFALRLWLPPASTRAVIAEAAGAAAVYCAIVSVVGLNRTTGAAYILQMRAAVRRLLSGFLTRRWYSRSAVDV